MKKILLASTALLGAASIVSSASAGATLGDTSSEGLELSISMSGGTAITYTDKDGGSAGPGWDVEGAGGKNELHFIIQNTTANGLKYGQRLELRSPVDGTIFIDENYTFFGGDFGLLEIGNADGAGGNYYIIGASVLPGDSSFDGSYIFLNGVGSGQTGDDAKINYTTPTFAEGLSLSASLTPVFGTGAEKRDAVCHDGTAVQTGADCTNADSVLAAAVTASPEYNNVYELGGSYTFGAGDTDVTVGGAYVAGNAQNSALEDMQIYNIGAKASFGPISVAVGLTDLGDGGKAKNTVGTDNGRTSGAGIAYDLGDVQVGLGFAKQTSKSGGTNTDTDFYSLGLTSQVAAGLSVFGEVANTSIEGGNDTLQAVLGTNISF